MEYNISFFLGVFSVCAGIFSLVFPPRKINLFYGYRTKLSQKKQLNWNYSNKISSQLLIAIGILTLVVNHLVGLFISICVFFVLITLAFYFIESKLKNL